MMIDCSRIKFKFNLIHCREVCLSVYLHTKQMMKKLVFVDLVLEESINYKINQLLECVLLEH